MKKRFKQKFMSYKTKSVTLKAKIRIFYIIFIWFRHLSLSPQLSLFAFLDTVIKRRQPKSTHRKFFILSVSSFEINYLNWTNQYSCFVIFLVNQIKVWVSTRRHNQ